MRPAVIAAGVIVGLPWAVSIHHGRLRLDPFAHARAPQLVSTQIDPTLITTAELAFGTVSYHVPMPAGLADGDSIELRFRDALDGARVDAEAVGPRSHAKLLHKRIGGDTVSVPLTPGRTDAVDIRVRHAFRAPPILRTVVVFAPVTPPAAGQPLAASPRSTR